MSKRLRFSVVSILGVLIIFGLAIALIYGVINKERQHDAEINIDHEVPAPSEPPKDSSSGNLPLIDGDAEPTGESPTESRVLNIYNWPTYIDPEIIVAFEVKFNATVNYDLYADNDELLARIQPANPGYDIIIVEDHIVQTLAAKGFLMELDKSRIPNFVNVDDLFLNPPYDPQNLHCIPYQWGSTGLGYNVGSVSSEIDSWSVMFDGTYQGRIGWLPEPRRVIGAALLYLGYDPNTTNPLEIDQAGQLLMDSIGDAAIFSPDVAQLLQVSEVDIVFEYSTTLIPKVEDEMFDIAYVIPREGTTILSDNMCIPKDAPHPDLAYEFINYILDAKIGAQLSNWTGLTSPNKESLPLIDEALRNNPAIYPSEEMRSRLYFIEALGDAEALYREIWDRLGITRFESS